MIARRTLIALLLVAPAALYPACASDNGADADGGAKVDGAASSSSSSSTSSTSSSSSGGADASNDSGQTSDETDVGCGGSTSPACGDGKKCKVHADCTSKSCQNLVCAAATATDGIKNGDESDIDCGGSASPKCADGKDCTKADNCVSAICTGANKCATPTIDGVKNGDETDVDCGGASSPKCADGKACKLGTSCVSDVCVGDVCQVPSPTDGKQNGDETDVDCGGATAPDCANGKKCLLPTDCVNSKCMGNICQPAAPDDGVKNGDETDVDCGGATTPKCLDGQGCVQGTSCTSQVCDGVTCQAPTFTDGVKNGNETDLDCGGDGDPAHGCAPTKTCIVSTDCANRGCDTVLGKCAYGRSCTMLNGGRSCGTNEAAGGAGNEDCCTTISLPNAPGGAIQMDKYLITAGRMRTFLESINGKVRDYVTANPPAGWNPAWTAYLPNSWDGRELIGGTYQVPPGEHVNIYSTYAQVAGAIIEDAPANQGCYIGGSYGHPTYLVPGGVHVKDGRNMNGAAQIYGDSYARWMTQANLDMRPLNCTPYPMFAAFCAWDGGRVVTEAQLNYVYDDDGAGAVSNYPWGSAPQAGGYQSVGGVWTKIGPATSGFSNTPCPTCVDNYINWRFNYQKIAPPGGTGPQDQSYFISPPGRFPLGASRQFNGDPAQRVQDISGLYIELTSTNLGSSNHTLNFGNADPADDRVVNVENFRWRGGSWEGHGVRDAYSFGAFVKYGKMGTRCAH